MFQKPQSQGLYVAGGLISAFGQNHWRIGPRRRMAILRLWRRRAVAGIAPCDRLRSWARAAFAWPSERWRDLERSHTITSCASARPLGDDARMDTLMMPMIQAETLADDPGLPPGARADPKRHGRGACRGLPLMIATPARSAEKDTSWAGAAQSAPASTWLRSLQSQLSRPLPRFCRKADPQGKALQGRRHRRHRRHRSRRHRRHAYTYRYLERNAQK